MTAKVADHPATKETKPSPAIALKAILLILLIGVVIIGALAIVVLSFFSFSAAIDSAPKWAVAMFFIWFFAMDKR